MDISENTRRKLKKNIEMEQKLELIARYLSEIVNTLTSMGYEVVDYEA